MTTNLFQNIYEKLYDYYGPQHWWPADTSFEMMVGSILVQNTNWRNVEKAMEHLRPHLDPQTLDEMPVEELALLIRPSGFYNIKAKRLKALLEWFREYKYDIEEIKRLDKDELRKQLLTVHGVGRESADVMLVYAFKKPIFVVDAYARRIFSRIGLCMPKSYDAFRTLIENELPDDVQLYNEYHALLVTHAKEICKVKPLCCGCPLLDRCQYGKEYMEEISATKKK